MTTLSKVDGVDLMGHEGCRDRFVKYLMELYNAPPPADVLAGGDSGLTHKG